MKHVFVLLHQLLYCIDENKYNHGIHNFNILFIITGKYIIYKIQVQCNYTILLLYFQLRPKIICINWIIPYICLRSYHQWKSLHFQLIREFIDCFIWSTTFLYIWHPVYLPFRFGWTELLCNWKSFWTTF